MKKTFILLAAMLTATLAFTQTTGLITGNLVDQSETGTSSGISLDVTLMNTSSQRCFVNGVGSLVKEKQTYTAAQVLAGITLAKNSSIVCGSSTGQTRWRFSFKNSQLNTSRDCDLQITGNTSLNTATCLQATTTPTTTVPTSSLFWLLDGSNSPTGNLVPAVNGTQSIGTSGSRWNMFANTMDVAGTSTLANVTMGAANTLSVNNIKQQAGTAFVLADPLGVSHFFISAGSPYTNSFVNGNGAGVVFLGSAAKTSVADTTGNITTAGFVILQTAAGATPAQINNDTSGGVDINSNGGAALSLRNAGTVVINTAGAAVQFRGATSGTTNVQASAVAGSGTLTLPATVTDTLVSRTSTDTLTNKIATTLGITGGTTNANLRFNSSAQIVNGNTTDDGTNFSTGTVKLQVQSGVTQGSGFKHQRFGATCTTTAGAGATCTTNYTWTSAFADANYTVTCQGMTQANTPTGPTLEGITASGFIARVSTILAAVSGYAGLDCIAIHD